LKGRKAGEFDDYGLYVVHFPQKDLDAFFLIKLAFQRLCTIHNFENLVCNCCLAGFVLAQAKFFQHFLRIVCSQAELAPFEIKRKKWMKVD
jgi:hypothetical protein